MKHIHSFEKFINESKREILNYSDSKNKILVGLKSNLLKDMKDRYDYTEDGDKIYFFDVNGNHFGTLFDVGTRHQQLYHNGKLDDKGWLKEEQRHKKVDHIENIEIKDKSDEDTERKAQKYIDDNAETCPRCNERHDDCQCESSDPWSTQNYHRVPKGNVK